MPKVKAKIITGGFMRHSFVYEQRVGVNWSVERDPLLKGTKCSHRLVIGTSGPRVKHLQPSHHFRLLKRCCPDKRPSRVLISTRRRRKTDDWRRRTDGDARGVVKLCIIIWGSINKRRATARRIRHEAGIWNVK